MPLTLRNLGAPEMMFRSATTRARADIGMDFFCPSMTMEQMLAVSRPRTRVGMATKGTPSLWAG